MKLCQSVTGLMSLKLRRCMVTDRYEKDHFSPFFFSFLSDAIPLPGLALSDGAGWVFEEESRRDTKKNTNMSGRSISQVAETYNSSLTVLDIPLPSLSPLSLSYPSLSPFRSHFIFFLEPLLFSVCFSIMYFDLWQIYKDVSCWRRNQLMP